MFTLAALAGFALAMLTLRPFRPCAEGHDLERTWTGAFRCRRCQKAFEAHEEGYVAPLRKQYGRGPDEGFVRSDWGGN